MALTRPRAYQIYDIDYKQSVRVVTVSNITLAGGAPNSVDGVNLTLNDRILVTGQSTGSQNGIYYVTTVGSGSNGTWARSTDTNATGELLSGTIVMVTEGTTYADTQWKLTTNDPITIGSTDLTFVQNYLANSISYGQTSFAIGSTNANATVSVAGTSNVAVFATTGEYVTGVVSASGNITSAGNISGTYILGNGSQLTGISVAATYGNSNVAAYLASGTNTSNIVTTGNVTGGNLTTANQLVASTATMSGATTVGVLYVGATGTATQIATNGTYDDWIGTNKTTGNTRLGGGSQTGYVSLGEGTSNSTVYIARGETTNTLTKTVSIGDNGLAGSNTSITVGTTAGRGNVTIGANTLFTISNTSGSALSVVGNITGGNLLTAGLVSVTGNITSSANISGAYILGNGSQLIGLPAGYSNSDVSTYLASGTNTANIITTGNVTGGNLTTTGLASVTGNVTAGGHVGTIYTNSIINTGGNGTGNIGSSALYFNTVFAKATSAQYADVAEWYSSDQIYEPGTVVVFDGSAEVTIAAEVGDNKVAGVVSTNPAYIMNAGILSEYAVPVALTGRVPTKIIGPVKKGNMMVSAGNGYAQACATPAVGTVIGKAIENFDGSVGVIEIVVGRL